nr:hypothetical protein [Tanacetum cinerariifolium]
GSDRDILGTDLDAIYETQRVGLTQFRLDVPDGEYELTLHLAELEAAPAAAQLAYNLAGEQASGSAPAAARRFGMLVRLASFLPGSAVARVGHQVAAGEQKALGIANGQVAYPLGAGPGADEDEQSQGR